MTSPCSLEGERGARYSGDFSSNCFRNNLPRYGNCRIWGIVVRRGLADSQLKVCKELTLRDHNLLPDPNFHGMHSSRCVQGQKSLLTIGCSLLLLLFGLSPWAQGAVPILPTAPTNALVSLGPVGVPITTSGVLSEVRVLTLGIPNADYTLNANGTCSAGSSFTAPSTCAVSVDFRPKAPGLRLGAVVLLGTSGEVLGTQPLFGIGQGAVSVFTPATIATVAGNGQWLYTGDGGVATDTSIFLPGGVALDAAGNFYVADSGNNRIRRVDGATGVITTVAGVGSPSSANNGSAGLVAGVSNPGALLLDGAGDLYIADSSNHAVRKLSLATGKLTTVAGQLNQQGYAGDGGLATAATLNTPEGLAFDTSGNLFIADTKNHVIRKVDVATGLISTYAGKKVGFAGDGGPATAASLNGPWGLASDVKGNLFIADLNNNRIRKVAADGTITTVVGNGTSDFAKDGQLATATPISNPAAIAVDVAGNLYVADSGHNAVRKVNAANGLTFAVAGTSNPVFSGDSGPATLAGLYGPYALTLDSLGNVFIADIFHHRIREVLNAQATLSYQPIRVGRTSPPQSQTIENDGNAPLTFSNLNPDANAAISTSTTSCVVGTPLAIDATCVIGAEFFPQVTGSTVTALIQPLSDAVNSPGTITLSGEVDELDPTKTALQTSANPAALGSTVTFTASVTGDAAQPTGNVRFFDGTTLLGTVATTASGTATFATNSLSLGSHAITANFTGDAQDSPSTSAVTTQVIQNAAVVTLSANASSVKVGESVQLTANVAVSGTPPTGVVVFYDGTTTLATSSLGTNGSAVTTINSLAAGTHTLSAVYKGDTNTLPGTSPTISEVVAKWLVGLTLSSSKATSVIGDPLTVSVTVTPSSTVTPSGSAVLKDGATTLGTLTLDATGSASYDASAFPVGTHVLSVNYLGDDTNASSTSASYTQTIQQLATATTLVSSANPTNGGAVLHLTAKVTAASTNATAGSLSGTLTIKDGSTVLGSGPLSADGGFTLDVSSLAVGDHLLVATYSGVTNYASSVSSTLDEKVILATTSVELVSSAGSIISGNSILLTAVVAGNGSVPTGSVNFFDGSVSLGSASLNSAGQANLKVGNLSSGSHLITAQYGGDTADSGSVSAAVTETVSPATTTIVLTSSSNPATAGAPLTFLASLTSNGSLPTGSIVLRDGTAVIGSALVGPTGAAQFTISSLTPQSHVVTAFFAGDADHLSSTSPALNQVIQLATSTASIASGQNPGLLGAAVLFTAQVNGTGSQPTGTVIFLDGTTTLATVPLTNGAASYSASSLTIGSHVITLRYDGDATHSGSAPVTLIEKVQQSTTTSIVSSLTPSLVGAPVTFNATVTGGSVNPVAGNVTFYDGATVLCNSSLSGGGTASCTTIALTAGTHLISASYQGDQNDRASQSVAISQPVNTADTSVALLSSANPSVAGSLVTFSATVVSHGQSATGSVTFLDGSSVLGIAPVLGGTATLSVKSLVAGQHAIIARYGGDGGTQVSTSSVLLQVAQQPTLATIVSNVNPALTAQSILLAATVGNGANATGTLSFFDGSTAIGTAAVGADGTAAITLPSLSAGTHSLSARYSGDSYNLPSVSGTLSEIVQLRPTTASMTASSAGYLDGQQVTLVTVIHYTGPILPTGTVTFTANGQVLGTSTVSAAAAATLTIEPSADRYDIVATYSGDGTYSGAQTSKYTITKGSSTSFSLTSDPSAFSLPTGDHRSLTLTITTSASFSDDLSLGCLNLPAEATCTFSSNQMKVGAGGTQTLTVMFDTGNPLGSGTNKTTTSARLSRTSSILEASFLCPAAILLGVLLVVARRGRRLKPLLAIVVMVGVGFASGCANKLDTTTTPKGAYTIRIIATGAQSSISQIADVAVTVQ